MIDTSYLDGVIVGRIDPHIYAFITNTVPNYLKVGDTYRPVNIRLDEWKPYYPDLEHKHEWEWKAKTGNGKYFRDFAVHYYLEIIKGLHRLQPGDIPNLPYYSREFFENATPEEVDNAIRDIDEYANNIDGTRQYQYYSEERLPEILHFERKDDYPPRPNQDATIKKFKDARANGHKHLLMYAVMRFGKSFTSMCCATEMNAKVVLILSAKADVRIEWQKTVESHVRFENYIFLNSDSLVREPNAISNNLSLGKCVAIFLTLQDLVGENIKSKHEDLFKQNIDLLIVDETHFGARAEEYGKILRDAKILSAKQAEAELKRANENTFEDIEKLSNITKELKVDTTIHLSGTPYRILMGSEFKNEDIIAFYQFTDIIDDKEAYDREHANDEDYNEWDNPYYGFPQMVRFAFNPNESARRLIDQLKTEGKSAQLSELLRPLSTEKDNSKEKRHTKFVHENEVLDLMKVIDGSSEDDNLLGFLDYDKLKEGKMCRHIVFVLPFCASCDAMEKLLVNHKNEFKNLNEYTMVNISGLENNFDSTESIKGKIKQIESEGKKSITLTVNRMLTGSTVREWDTMLILKDMSSPQEYDQAIFRLQNQYIKTYKDEKGDIIKYNMKPQTLLVDFDPSRMFYMQEQKSMIYNVNTNGRGNDELDQRLKRELEISPIIVINKGKIGEVTPTDIMNAVREYSASKTVMDEATSISTDFELINDPSLWEDIKDLAPIDNKNGINIKPVEGPGDDYTEPDDDDDDNDKQDGNSNKTETNQPASINNDEQRDKRLAALFARILFFALLTKDIVTSLLQVIESIKSDINNQRIARNVGLKYKTLWYLSKHINPFVLSELDYKINNINDIVHDESISPIERVERALKKFGRLSDSEIVTPSWLADDMISLLPKNELNNNSRFIDIASKQGEFACAIYKRFTNEIGLEIKNNIYALPTSSITYEFTRKVFELLDIPVENIFSSFNSYDLIGKNKDNYIKILKNMKFNVVVGNPPYQDPKSSDKTINNAGFASAIYPLFMDCANDITNNFVSLITPSRWLNRVGQGISDTWIDKMLGDNNHFCIICDYLDANDCFSDVELKGGVNYFLWDNKYKGKCRYILHQKGKQYERIDNLDPIGAGVVIRDSMALGIIKKILLVEGDYFDDKSYVSIVSPKHYFDKGILLSSNWKGYSKNKDDKHPVKYYLNRKLEKCGYGWIQLSDIPKGLNTLPLNKVYIPKSGGTGTDPNVLGHPILGEPQSVCSYTYLVLGYDPKNHNFSEQECLNMIKYIKTQFFRYMVSIKKKTQDNTRDVFQFVPQQDLSSSSDIDWTQSIDNINEQLYRKYKLSKEEIIFIEKMINPML